MQKKTATKVISLLLTLAMTIGLMPASVLANTSSRTQSLSGHGEKVITTAERSEAKGKLTASDWNVGLAENRSSMNGGSRFSLSKNGTAYIAENNGNDAGYDYADTGRQFSKAPSDAQTDKSDNSKDTYLNGTLGTDAVTYLNALAEALQQPAGAQGFEDGYDDNPEEMVEIVVQFVTMPSEMIKLYNRQQGVYTTKAQAETVAEAAHVRFNNALNKLTSLNRSVSKIEIIGEHSTLFNGVYLRVPAGMVEQIAALSEVYCVTPNVTYYACDYGDFTGEGMSEARELFDTEYIHDTLGLTGAGVTVAVLDTGIDYNHPDLEHAYQGGYDCIDDDSDPMETTYQDFLDSGAWYEFNPYTGSSYYTDHGTHVSGSIAARGESGAANATLGMAPESELLVYRVLGPYGQSSGNSVMEGIERAYEDGADVMNLSLGADIQLPYDPEAFALNAAVANGVVVCISAGNAGPGSFTLGTPGVASLPITVGAGQNGGFGASGYASAVVDGNTLEIDLHGWKAGDSFDEDMIDANTGLTPLPDDTYEYVMVPGYGTARDFSNAEDLTGKIAVVYRGGGVNFTVKRDQAVKAGAGALILINNEGESRLFGTSVEGEQADNVIPVFAVRETDGYILKDAYESDNAYIMLGEFAPDLPADDNMAPFSSNGPVRSTWQIKPDIVAPGVNILSTAPNYITNADHSAEGGWENAYQYMSGTSMAAPCMAGIAALMVEKFPEAKPEEIKARLMNTARPLNDGDYSVFQVGAGFVQPKEALESTIYATVEQDIPWLDGDGGRMLQTATLPSLNFGVIDAGESGVLTVELHGDTAGMALTYDVEYNDAGFISASCAANGVTLDVIDNGGGVYTVKMDIPVTAEMFTTYEGYLVFKDGGVDVIRIPFAGFYRGAEVQLDPADAAKVTLEITGDPYGWITNFWEDFEYGYQFLLDGTHTAYGTVIDGRYVYLEWQEFYDAFTHTIPDDPAFDFFSSETFDTSHVVVPPGEGNIVRKSVTVPAGTYDWVLWWASNYGDLSGYVENDFEFEPKLEYIFSVDDDDNLSVRAEGDPSDPTTITDVSPSINAPRYGKTPQLTVDELKYTGSIEWTPAVPDKFDSDTVYKAKITLTANSGLVFDAVDTAIGLAVGTIIDTDISADGKTLVINVEFPSTVITTNGTATVILSNSTPVIMEFGLLLDSMQVSIDKLLTQGTVNLGDDFDFYVPEDMIEGRNLSLVKGNSAYAEIPAGTYDWMVLTYEVYEGGYIQEYAKKTFEAGKTYVFDVWTLSQDWTIDPSDVFVNVYELDPNITSVGVKPDELSGNGGNSRVTFYGEFQPVPTEVGVFLEGVRVTDAWAADLETGYASFNAQRIYIDFPANTSGAPQEYEIKLWDESAVDWFDLYGTVTVSDEPDGSGDYALVTVRLVGTSSGDSPSGDGLQFMMDSNNTPSLDDDWYNWRSFDYHVPKDLDLDPYKMVLKADCEETFEISPGLYSFIWYLREPSVIDMQNAFRDVEFESGRHYEFTVTDAEVCELKIDGVVQPVFPLTDSIERPEPFGIPQTALSSQYYSGTITWDNNPGVFDYGTVYTAHVNVAAEPGYNLSFLNKVNMMTYELRGGLRVTGAETITGMRITRDTVTFDAVFPSTIEQGVLYSKVILTAGDVYVGSNGYYLLLDETRTWAHDELPFAFLYTYGLPLGCIEDDSINLGANSSDYMMVPPGIYDICVTFGSGGGYWTWEVYEPDIWLNSYHPDFELEPMYAYEFIFNHPDRYWDAGKLYIHAPANITATADAGRGTVTGGGTYIWSDKVYLTATPNSGYGFDGWYEGNTRVSSAAAYTFVATEDRALEARFSATSTGGGGGGSATNASITPVKADFNKDDGKDITIALSPGSYTLRGLKNGDNELVKDTDYTVNGNNITIKTAYLSTLAVGEQTITFEMSGGTNPKLTIDIIGSITDPEIPLGFANPYTDVKDTDWFYDAVRFATESGIMAGTGNGRFSPNTTMTRAMFAQILYNYMGKPAVDGKSQFDDVTDGNWYTDAVIWAAKQGIVSGYGNGNFGPNDQISREQMIMMVYNFAKSQGYDVSAADNLSGFNDADQIADWALPAIQWAVHEGVISGMTPTTIGPKGTATRAQAAAMFKNFIELFIEREEQ